MPSPHPLSFGYIYDFRNPPQWHRPWAELYAETLDFIAWSEAAGFDGAWVPEHHGAGDGYAPSPMVILAAIAARTRRLRIGSGIALGPLHHPLRFAEEAVLLDILSNGRFEAQLAIGYRARETAMFGRAFRQRGKVFDEFLAIATRLLAGEEVSHAGEHFTVERARVMPPPTRHIPLYIGGFVGKALERVARYGDGFFGDPGATAAYQAKLAEAGKDPAGARVRIPCLFTVVARDVAEAVDELAPHFHHINNSYGEWNAEDNAMGDASPTLAAMSLEEFKASGILEVLTPGQAIDKFRALRERIPLEHVMMGLPAGYSPMAFRKYAGVFAEEVIPAFG